MPGWRAGSGVGKYNAESPKQDSKRFYWQVRWNTLPIWICFFYLWATLWLLSRLCCSSEQFFYGWLMDGFKPHYSTSTMLGGGRRQKTPLYPISYKMIDENVIKNAEILHCYRYGKIFSGDSEKLHGLFHETTRTRSCFCDFHVVSRTNSCCISESPLHFISFLTV